MGPLPDAPRGGGDADQPRGGPPLVEQWVERRMIHVNDLAVEMETEFPESNN